MSIFIEHPGYFTTIQDLGRPGFRKWGVPECGAADRGSLILANQILQNLENTPALECTLRGGTFVFEDDATIAITGAQMNPEVNGIAVSMNKKVHLRKGDKLSLSTAVKAYRSYVAIEGGFRIKEVMGSASTCINAGFGGHKGRCLKAGDRLEWKLKDIRSSGQFSPSGVHSTRANKQFNVDDHIMINIRPGPEWALLDTEQKETFVRQTYRVEGRSDRMAIHLSGTTAINLNKSMVSSPVIPGVIQLPPRGTPMILFRDAQTMGGYPRVGIIQDDQLDLLAQIRPGGQIQFRLITSFDP